MFDEIVSSVKTIDEKQMLLDEIELLLHSLYKKSAQSFEDVLRTQVRSRIAQKIEEILRKESGEKHAILEKLQETVLDLPVMELTLAFEPTETSLQRLSTWVKTNVGAKVVFQLKYDRSILGGVIMIHEGEYRDYSVRRQLERIINEEQGQIAQLLNQ